MIHFFRKIRRDLLTNNQFFKYLKYAIGEIVLVVLGILIALYINNQNEIRKEQDKFEMALIEVEKELVNNIQLARVSIHDFARHDSLCIRLFLDSLKLRDNYSYLSILAPVTRVRLADEALMKLNQINYLTYEQETIRDNLIELNTVGRGYIGDYGDALITMDYKRTEDWQKYDWYLNWVFRRVNDDERVLDFAMNDPDYLKMAATYYEWISGFRKELQSYEYKAVSIYRKIHKYLVNNGMKKSDSILFDFDPKDFEHYLGKYDSKWSSFEPYYVHDDSIVVGIEKGKLIWNGYRSDGPDSRKEIIPIDYYRFMDERAQGIYHLEFDYQGNVEGITFSFNPTYIIKMEKIQ